MDKSRQVQIILEKYGRGFHLITEEVLAHLGILPRSGMLHLFIQHTSAGICINENADPTVRSDFQLFFDRLAPEHLEGIRHTMEGPDDMPAHIKSVLSGCEITIPIVNQELGLGTWQGIFLCEFRNQPTRRRLMASLISF